MEEVRVEITDNLIKVWFKGRIDSTNADAVKKELFSQIGDAQGRVVVDASELEYISSAGLRILLQLRKTHEELNITDVSPEIYEILDVTGFTQMMDVTRAYKKMSIEGCEVIGRGANGTIYRTDDDTVVKVYNDPDSTDDIKHEREVARLALILGIPTAISYDIVKVGDCYGSVFEMLNANSFSNIIASEPDKLEWCADEYIKLLRKIHETEVPEGKLPDMKMTVLDWANFMIDYLPPEYAEKLVRLVEEVPHNDHMIHGDYHTKNVMLTDDDILLIDMDTLAVGDPVFEFASIFNAYIGFHEIDHDLVRRFQGFSYETSLKFWNMIIEDYVGTDDSDVIRDKTDKARVIGYTRLIRRSIRRGGLEDENKKAEIDHWTGELIELLDRVDSLSYVE